MRTRTNGIVSYACSLFADPVDKYTLLYTSHCSKYTILFIWCVLLFAIFTVSRLRSQTDLLLCYFCVRMNGIVHMDECVMCMLLYREFPMRCTQQQQPQTRKITLIGFVSEMGFYSSLRVSVFFSLYHFHAAAVASGSVSLPFFMTFETRLNMQFFSMYFSCRVQSSPQRRT